MKVRWPTTALGGAPPEAEVVINEMYYTYIIKSEKNGRYYIGSTEDIEKRLKRHNEGKNISTRNFIPWNLVYSEKFETRQEAYRREMRIKKYKGGEAFKKLLV